MGALEYATSCGNLAARIDQFGFQIPAVEFRPTAGPRLAPNLTSNFERPLSKKVAGSLRRKAGLPDGR